MFRESFLVPRLRYSGYTLIEMIAVIAIMGILSAVVLVSWSKGRVNQEIILAAREFESVIHQAQGYAISGKLDPNNPSDIPCNYGLSYLTASTYRIRYTYRPAGSNVCSSSRNLLPIFTLPSGVTFGANWGQPLGFTLPLGMGDGAGVGGGNRNIVLKKTGGDSVTVCVPGQGKFSC